jgi:hypothetical protein
MSLMSTFSCTSAAPVDFTRVTCRVRHLTSPRQCHQRVMPYSVLCTHLVTPLSPSLRMEWIPSSSREPTDCHGSARRIIRFLPPSNLSVALCLSSPCKPGSHIQLVCHVSTSAAARPVRDGTPDQPHRHLQLAPKRSLWLAAIVHSWPHAGAHKAHLAAVARSGELLVGELGRRPRHPLHELLQQRRTHGLVQMHLADVPAAAPRCVPQRPCGEIRPFPFRPLASVCCCSGCAGPIPGAPSVSSWRSSRGSLVSTQSDKGCGCERAAALSSSCVGAVQRRQR